MSFSLVFLELPLSEIPTFPIEYAFIVVYMHGVLPLIDVRTGKNEGGV